MVTNRIQDYYSAALFGWTHNATIMNLKFDAHISENRDRSDYSNFNTAKGAGLIGNAYGSINVFNVENNLTGNYSYAGIIGSIDQRINYYDKRKYKH